MKQNKKYKVISSVISLLIALLIPITAFADTTPYWCDDGGTHHSFEGGIGWYSSYSEAQNAARARISEHGGSGSYEVQQCDLCGLFTAYVTLRFPDTEPTGHSYKYESNKNNTHTKICTVCGFEATENCSYKTNTTKATMSKNGSVETKCSKCGYIKSKSTVYYPKTIKLEATALTYNGKARTPRVYVKDSNGKTISSGNYTVSYASGHKKIGKYAVKIKFKGNYSGTKTLYFKINPKLNLSKTSYTYNGKAKKPTVTVKDNNGKKISTKYYSVNYPKGRKNPGKYTVTIKFKNGHSGTYKKVFTIKPKGTTPSSVKAGDQKITVKWKKQKSHTDGYQIQYATDSKFTKNKKTLTVSNNNTTSKSFAKIFGKTKYYVRVRTYKTVKINGNTEKIYSSWSKAKSIKAKAPELSDGYWCWEGGSHHVITEGIGWYSSYSEAENAALARISEHGGSGSYEVQQCDCNKFTAYVNLR